MTIEVDKYEITHINREEIIVPERKNGSVVVVDDEHDVLTVSAKALELGGYVVHAFDRPELAFDHIKECKDCAVVVSDIRMPGMSGIQLARQINEIRPEVKIILTSAFEINNEEWRKVLPSTKIGAFLKKPFSMAHLIQSVTNLNEQANWVQR